jgi:hypothetical protein
MTFFDVIDPIKSTRMRQGTWGAVDAFVPGPIASKNPEVARTGNNIAIKLRMTPAIC